MKVTFSRLNFIIMPLKTHFRLNIDVNSRVHVKEGFSKFTKSELLKPAILIYCTASEFNFIRAVKHPMLKRSLETKMASGFSGRSRNLCTASSPSSYTSGHAIVTGNDCVNKFQLFRLY